VGLQVWVGHSCPTLLTLGCVALAAKARSKGKKQSKKQKQIKNKAQEQE
jgi:hypothetical protein